ncbi:hypothetical protein F511_02288 [Dorcoceras hygrometricum]|uniref:C2H2-type domain-containing protein n=1 Tax=Dorcoceras hygrometricum TaxID=472368 RepID=A0A2Z7CFB6_9LAMI|nr:hypothetical protein F511_02288 [Dorcoceras hygrometricum]
MGEVQEQRYRCNICSKFCVNGKSLGGHMRVHMALFSASRKSAESKAEGTEDFEGGDDQNGFQIPESVENQSNIAEICVEKIQNCDSMGLGDGDKNNSYELRDNPKKSWRISDSKNGVSIKAASCGACGKTFSSLRALSGHMRCHSVKNSGFNLCKKCGKEFDSPRALFGHMKCHSKKHKNYSAESASELDLCPIRRKLRIRYNKTDAKPSVLGLNASKSAFSEFGEFEEVAMCLIMLSEGVKEWDMLNPVTESPDDDSACFGSQSSGKSMRVSGNDGDFRSKGKMDIGIQEKNLAEVDEMKVNIAASSDGLPREYEYKELEQFNGAGSEFLKLNSSKRPSLCVDSSSVEKDSADTDLEILNETEKKRGSKCTLYVKNFRSQLALRGDNARQSKRGNNSSLDLHTSLSSVTVVGSQLDQIKRNANQPCQGKAEKGSINTESSKRKERECPICFKVFSSGKALGGHKRAHFSGCTGNKLEDTSVNPAIIENHGFPDLNFPATIDEGIKGGDVGLSSCGE